MGKCIDWSSGSQCPNEAVSGGLCQAHIDQVAQEREANAAAVIPPPQAIRWTPADIKKTFGAIKNGGRDDSGGQYLGGGKGELHVHLYNDGGAHVKVGNKEYRFLNKPDFRFDRDRWNEGVAAVRALGGNEDKIKQMLGAMAMTLAQHGGLSDGDFSDTVTALGYEKK